jgi:uncharacterized membrane protein YkvI
MENQSKKRLYEAEKMSFLKTSFFKKYLLPGFVFQSVLIGGGYGTGRELVEFFLSYGPLGGLMGMLLVSTVIWSLLLAVTFEFSRKFRAYDYRTFFKHLLGPFWFVFEIIYFLYMLIVLAVVGSAAGILLRDNFGIPYLVGVIFMLTAVGFLTFKGSGLIENFLSVWSMILYAVYAAFLVIGVMKFGPEIQKNFSEGIVRSGWALGGFKYALYNLGNIAAVLFCLNHIEKRKEAISAGLIGGVIGIIPAVLFYIPVVGLYPNVLSEEIPAVFLLQKASIAALLIVFQVILFGTLIETGTGFIHAVNQRIQVTLKSKGKKFTQWHRPVVAVTILLISLGISTFGLINLIAKGYGAASWGFLVVFILPLVTVGIYKIIKN